MAGCTVIFSALFTIGNILYGRWNYALALLAIFIVSGLALLYVVSTLWSDKDEPDATGRRAGCGGLSGQGPRGAR
jgi:hypothetical protein